MAGRIFLYRLMQRMPLTVSQHTRRYTGTDIGIRETINNHGHARQVPGQRLHTPTFNAMAPI